MVAIMVVNPSKKIAHLYYKSGQHLHGATLPQDVAKCQNGWGKNVQEATKLNLVGGFNQSEKYYIVNWDDYSQYIPIYGKKNMFQTTNQKCTVTRLCNIESGASMFAYGRPPHCFLFVIS